MLKPLQADAQRQQQARRQADVDRGSSRERGYDTRWDRYSLWFRSQAHCPECGRNHVLCEICQAVGKVDPGEMVDHILPVQDKDDRRFWDHSNHQTLSNTCHHLKTQEDIRKGLTRGMRLPTQLGLAPVVVVSGKPGTGKTTHVQQHAQRGDLIVDLDALFSALSGLPVHAGPDCLLPFVASARDAIYDRLMRPSDIRQAWIITSDLQAAFTLVKRFNAQHVQIQCDESERLKRLAARRVE